MCSVPKPEPVPPLITFDPNAGKSARVRTAAAQSRVKKRKKSGLARLTAPAAGGSISDLLAGLTIGSATEPAL